MKIYSMTATFGKLEHEKLTLQPGLNIIEAPNEWGKSTWCAFLVNMLYGIDTKARTTKTELADKERYAPWSGAPMAGRIELNWNGRDITIERRTRGRLIFGEFSAYETATGLEVPELNGTNCGQMLLGVERSVFTRAGFLKLTDLPVTQDDSLRRRLNNLVTTGDESGAGDKLQKALKDLKNKCRYNKSGLLPQAESQRDHLESQLNELGYLTQQSENLQLQQKEIETRISRLENHKAALLYAEAQEDAEKVKAAASAAEDAKAVYESIAQNCEGLPTLEEARQALQTGTNLQQQLLRLQTQSANLPPLPQQPEIPAHYQGIAPEQAEAAAQEDLDALAALEKKRSRKNMMVTVFSMMSAAALIAAAVAWFVFHVNAPILYLVLGFSALSILVGVGIFSVLFTRRWRDQVELLYDKHPGKNAGLWLSDASAYRQTHEAYTAALAAAKAQRGDLDQHQAELTAKIKEFAPESDLADAVERWQQVAAARNALQDAARDMERAQSLANALSSMAKTAEPPKFADIMTESAEETNALLNNARFELRQLQQKLGQCQGRAEALGQESVLRTQLKAVTRRIHKLEDTYAALELAQTALSAATSELQRRFAPRIAKRAQELFSKLTGGRYDRLTLSEDLSLNTSAQEEDTMRSSQWRSDGTVDQLYLALRLAVAEELTPDAPLILDDALVRFDDKRLATAMDILKETGETKQVILFTCQGREKKLQGE